ncbi:MAG: NAD(P)H-hydrate dehydratase [Nitrospirota bacterium]
MKVVTTAEMQLLDSLAVSEFKIPGALLMENAARGLIDKIEEKIGSVSGTSVVLLCGGGNNGGDGIAAARHLRMRGARFYVYLFTPLEKLSKETQAMFRAMHFETTLYPQGSFTFEALEKNLSESHLIIDALLGTGLSRAVTGDYQKAIDCINNVRRKRNITVISVDIPSGISADTGEQQGSAVLADYTFTMGLPKRGLFMREGLLCRGQWDVIDIGFPKELIDHADIRVELVSPNHLTGFPNQRPLDANKSTFGHLLVIAGSRGKKGAAALASLSALRVGTGLVTTALPHSSDSITPSVMEAMTLPVSETDEGTLSLKSEEDIWEASAGKSAIAIGPGLSQNLETVRLILNLIAHIESPMVIDADAINALATDLSILSHKKSPVILTPHPGEMARLVGTSSKKIQEDRIGYAISFAKKWGVIVVLKGAHTIIADPAGSVFISNTGNPGMATAGVGDVLTGMIGGFLAQGVDPIQSAIFGVVLHGIAGDIAAQKNGQISLIASDIIKKIPKAILTVMDKGRWPSITFNNPHRTYHKRRQTHS